MKKTFLPADILFPDFNKYCGEKWSVVACDQYTSEPEYWRVAEDEVGDAPSTLRLILPEVYLDKAEERIPKINAAMEEYDKEILDKHPNSMIYLERTQSDGKVRHGIIGMIDLEDYDYNKGSASLIRATEGTVLSRIPPRVKIRRGAGLELPHVLLLIDDPECTVIEKTGAKKDNFKKAYDFNLMQRGGHVRGWFIDADTQKSVLSALDALVTPEKIGERYGDKALTPLLFAVGDGNHSLATAKACYEELKTKIGAEQAASHPSRYALVEVVNLHDKALSFEPIYRVMFGVDVFDVKKELRKYESELHGGEKAQEVQILDAEGQETLKFEHPTAQLTVGTLQKFIDDYTENHHGITIDYIHGEESLKKLASRECAVGFIFRGMEKSELFRTVIYDGALPRKTFSMGHADDKRYYLECRRIK